jgi:hypothetical protein
MLLWQRAKDFVVIDRQINAEVALGLCLFQTTFIQATKNLHQTLCLFKKITFIAGHDFNPPRGGSHF